MHKHIISLTLRLILGLNFLLVPIAHLKWSKFYVEDPTTITSWITSWPIIGNIIAIGLFLASFFLLFGFKTIWATLSSISLLLINHICLLFTNPSHDPFDGAFYNSFHHSVPFIGFSILLMYTLSAPNDLSIDRFLSKKTKEFSIPSKNEITFLIVRIFIGILFFAQGLELLTGEASLMSFAENVYVNNYESTFIPKFLLWFMGLSNPWILCVGGLFLTLGLKTKWSAYILAFFMVSIAFGHIMGDPFETTGDISMYGFNNFAFVLLALWFENGKNKFTIDNLLTRKKN
jgi:uncharacterized membrane protein YphA (DoxX/SURF4 family)